MNKNLTISLVAALGVVGGGAYMIMDSDKNLSEFIPEPVTALIGNYLPDNLKAKHEVIYEDSLDAVVVEDSTQVDDGVNHVVEEFDQVAEATSQEADDSTQVAQNLQESTPQIKEDTQEVAKESIQQQSEQITEQDALKQGDENIVAIAMQEIQNSLNEPSAPVKTDSVNPKAKVIEKEIVAVSSEISKLDMENKELEKRFQNILRKNRELAKQLQEIDEQLTQSN